MINVPAGARVLLATRPIDFRKGAHSLAALAQEVLAENPFSGAVIVYRAMRSDRLKILVWDTSGLVLVWKQLQQGSFRWPPIMDGVMKLSPIEFTALFETITGPVFRQPQGEIFITSGLCRKNFMMMRAIHRLQVIFSAIQFHGRIHAFLIIR